MTDKELEEKARELARKLFGSQPEETYVVDILRMLRSVADKARREALEDRIVGGDLTDWALKRKRAWQDEARREEAERHRRSLGEALNSGDGSYKP
jgi:hypothetical protein